MQRYLSIYRSNPFFKNNFIFFLGSASVGALNYLFYPVVGRLMSPSAFGEVQTLISFFLQLTIFLNVLSLVVVNLITNEKSERAQRIVTELQLAALWVSVGLLVVTCFIAPLLQRAFRFESGLPFILLGAALVGAVPFTFQTAYLRARQRFAATSLANLLVAGGKIIFSVLFVVLGLQTSGAIGGLVAAQLIGLIYALSAVQKGRMGQLYQSLRKRWWPDMRVVIGEMRYVVYALVGSLGVIMLLSLDVIIVKYFFDAHTAGLYAGVATVARIIFFLTASIAQVLLASVKVSASDEANWALLKKSILILAGLSAPVLIVCSLFPAFVMSLLMGNQYVEYATLVTPLCWAIFSISLLNLFMLYSLALRQYMPAILTMTGALMTYAAMAVWHGSLSTIVTVLLIGSVATVGMTAGWVISKSERSK